MRSFNEKCLVIVCDSTFVITEIIAIKNIGMSLQVNDHLNKIVSPDNIEKFLEFSFKLQSKQAIFGVEMNILDDDHSVSIMNFGGIAYHSRYIITAFSNYLDLYAELMMINNECVNELREKFKKTYSSPDNYQKFMELNNEIINIQRELYKKNAYVSDLLKKKQEMIQIIETQKKFLKQMINVIPDPIFYKDKFGTYLGCNKAFAENVIGLTEEEIIGKSNMDFITGARNVSFFRENDQTSFASEECKTWETAIDRTDGTVCNVEITNTPFEDEKGDIAGVIGILHDISVRKQNEFEIIKTKEEAIRATLMKSRFLAHMSHEIRTPMNGILGFLELLQRTALSIEQREYIKGAKGASEMLLYLISDILDFSKIEAGKLTVEKTQFKIKEVIEDSISVFVPKILEKNIKIHKMISKNVPEDVIGDPARLRQILNNLISNAVKFTQNGKIDVRVACTPGTDGQGVFDFEVQDTGIGISEQNINKLFSPFVQAEESTTRNFGGTGLGLVISKELITLMNGDISIESEVGKGSIFRFTVILEFVSATMVHEEGVPYEMPLSNIANDKIKNPQPRILLAEDDEINRKIIIAVLQEKNMICDVAIDGREAVTAVMEKDYDIVFMDCQMPVMDGYESVAEIRALEGDGKHTWIVAMTANAMAGDREKSIKAGMDDYISKPIDFKVLFTLIEGRMKDKK